MGQRQAQQLAAAIHGLAEQTAGAGNFRFGVGFNCHPGIPFFPVAASAADVSGFAIGTENSGLLFRAFQQAVADSASTTAACSVLAAAQRQLQAVMTAALQPVQELAEQLAAAHGQPYLGIDASIAPALEPPSIPAAYELLGLGRFGGSGTLAISGVCTPVWPSRHAAAAAILAAGAVSPGRQSVEDCMVPLLGLALRRC